MTQSVYRVDPLHLGIRLLVPITMLLAVALAVWVIIPALLVWLSVTGVFEVLFYGVGVLLVAVGLPWGTEALLRAVWPSGRVVTIDDKHVVLRERSGDQVQIDWDKHVNVLTWHFVIRQRRAWVRKGWFCAACRLVQDDKVIAVYTFVKPSVAQEWPYWSHFEELVSQKRAPRQGEESQLIKVGEQVQLRSAERDRWSDGGELSPEDFAALVTSLGEYVTDWPGVRA